MPEVSMTEAKRDFFKLIKRVMKGEVFVITRWGKPVAKLVPAAYGNVTAPASKQG